MSTQKHPKRRKRAIKRRARPKTVHTLESLQAKCLDEGECLVWAGYFENGTPKVSHNGALTPARRLFHFLTTGKLRTEGFFYAKCGNAACAKPEHTAHLSHKQHMRRISVLQAKMPSTNAIRKAKISRAKRMMTDAQIAEILASNEPALVLAQRFGCSKSTVNNYRRGQHMQLQSNPWAGLLIGSGL